MADDNDKQSSEADAKLEDVKTSAQTSDEVQADKEDKVETAETKEKASEAQPRSDADASTTGEEKKEAKKKKAKKVEVPKEFKNLVSELDKLSALEISKFVKFLEEYWGVSAAAPAVAMAAAPVAGGDAGAPAEEEKKEFDVLLKDAGAQKVAVIKAVKDITNLGLGEAKAIVDGVPGNVLEKAKKEDAEAAKKALEEAGATVELV